MDCVGPECEVLYSPVRHHIMPDPLRSDGPRAIDAAPDASRDAKIEQLLLAGLDQYFAGQYEQAVNVWTRVLFLDRSHPKARAYIERARSALAERQRQSEELVHTSVEALHRGDGVEARRLIQAAIEGGASDEAFAVLDRLDRLEQSPAVPPIPSAPKSRRPSGPPRAAAAGGRPMWSQLVIVPMVLAAALIGAIAASPWKHSAWQTLSGLANAPAASAIIPSTDATPPLPRRGEVAVGRARTLAAGGRLHDALTALDDVRATDPQKADADRLRAEIQHQLLGLPAGPGEKGDRPLP